jgi:chromosome segregation ATPase
MTERSTDLESLNPDAEISSLKGALLSVSLISDKALAEVARLRRQRLVLALHLGKHRNNSRLDQRELHAFASEIHHLTEELKIHQKALLTVAGERDDLRKNLAAERQNAVELTASLQADLEDARSAACELDAKWRIAVEAEHFALQQIVKPPKASWHTRISHGLDRLASRILLGKGASRSLEALDG